MTNLNRVLPAGLFIAALAITSSWAQETGTPEETSQDEDLTVLSEAETMSEPGEQAEDIPVAPILNEREGVDEVIVTANRRAQNVQDVVGSLQVFDGEELDKQGTDGLDEIVLKVPGAAMRQMGNGDSKMAIRGISNVSGTGTYGDGVSTIGFYINDISIQGAASLPDLALYDLNRVEILKGPQGTLYGEGSMGGAVKLILNEASTDEWQYKMDLRGWMTEEGDNSWSAKGLVNIPILEDHVGARLVVTAKEVGGYVDYVLLDEENADSYETFSARLVVDIRVDDRLSFEIFALHDVFDMNAFPTQNPNLPEYQNDQAEDLFTNKEVNIGGLTMHYDLGFATLSSVTSGIKNNSDTGIRFGLTANLVEGDQGEGLILQEYSRDFGIYSVYQAYANSPIAQAVPVIIVPRQQIVDNEPMLYGGVQEGYSQEFRLVSNEDKKFDWVLGAFYRHLIHDYYSDHYMKDLAPIADPTGGSIDGATEFSPFNPNGFTRDGREFFEQLAFYGEFNWEFMDDFELTAGLRYFTEKVALINDDFRVYGIYAAVYAAYGAPTRYLTNLEAQSEEFLPKVSLSWGIGDDHMVYALASRGFRSASPNLQFSFEVGPPIIHPDTLWNYELGVKTQWFQKALTFNASVFMLDWTEVQTLRVGVGRLGLIPLETTYYDNAGNAEVYGLEVQVFLIPMENTFMGLAYSHLQGEITEVKPESRAYTGRELPQMPNDSFSGFVGYQHDLWQNILGSISASYNYVGGQTSVLQSEGAEHGYPLDAYHFLGMQVAVEGENWAVTAFATNMLDTKPLYLSLNDETNVRPWEVIGRPPEVGLNFHVNF